MEIVPAASNRIVFLPLSFTAPASAAGSARASVRSGTTAVWPSRDPAIPFLIAASARYRTRSRSLASRPLARW